MINRENPFDDLRRLFSAFLGTKSNVGQSYNAGIPKGLRELYQIHESYSVLKPENTLFNKQDRLLLPSEIKGDQFFDFLTENQSCWKCETERDQENPPVYIHDAESIDIIGRKIINNSLNEFLTTYALLELTFELNFSINEHFNLNDILSSSLKTEELWMNKSYTWGDGNRYSFWLVEDSCLIMDCSIRYFGTNDLQKFDFVNKLLKK
jgi:hypothetical protein